MKNPFKQDDRAAGRAATHDHPLVPNAIERPVERALADDRDAGVRRTVADRPIDVHRTVADHPIDEVAPPHRSADTHVELFPDDELIGYRTRWDAIQTGFVDEPRAAVEQADALVSQVVNRLTEGFTRERSTLEGQWTRGDNVSTEDLRLSLQRYRSFFHRLLSM